MADPDVRFNQLISALKEHDFRLTPQRVELVRLIAGSEGRPNSTQFYEMKKLKFPIISLAKAYKTLALLKEMNQVLEIDLREDSHYDGNRPHPHPYLICMECNKIVDGEASLDQESLGKLEEVSGYTILRPQISFYGLCPDCMRAN